MEALVPRGEAPRPAAAARASLLRRVVRVVSAWLCRALYRVRAHGLEHLAGQGAALVVANHVAYVDAFLVAGLAPRPVRMVYWQGLERVPLLGPFLRAAGGIPVGAEQDPSCTARGLEAVSAALDAGELVVLFPEGALTRDGEVARFRSGVERILSRRAVPVVPLAIRGLWGSMFSRARRWRSRRVRPVVEVVVARPLAPAGLTATQLRGEVLALRGSAR